MNRDEKLRKAQTHLALAHQLITELLSQAQDETPGDPPPPPSGPGEGDGGHP